MFEISALIAAIFLLTIIIQLRTVLALIFPHYQAKIIHIKPPASVSDLFMSADSELQHEGFQGPIWLMIDSDPIEGSNSPICAVYRHPESQTLAWNMMPSNVTRPNCFNRFYTTTLDDGRVITSQVYDFYFSIVANEAVPAQILHTDVVTEQVKAHQHYVTGFACRPRPDATGDEEVIRLAADHMNQQRQRLVESGLLWQDRDGVARPRLKFALKILKTAFGQKASAASITPVPAARLAWLATCLERIRHREPSFRSQVGLFAFSVILSVIAGAILWDVQFAVILLVVVIFHEFGHYLAMRMFGYKNVHMMALPLVGGVTIGFDTNPSAWRRAWMSMMGPLPGIILGWVLFYYILTVGGSVPQAEWLNIAIFTLLFINYLNVIPVLPLDGGHVAQSLIPARLINVHAVFIIITCLLGIVIAIQYEFYILAVLAGLYLLSVPSYLRSGKIVRHLLAQKGDVSKQRAGRMLAIFKAYEEVVGPAVNARRRIDEAELVLTTLETQPMSWLQRLIVGTVYSGMLLVPVTALVFGMWTNLFFPLDVKAMNEQVAQVNAEVALYQGQAAEMSPAELFTDIIGQPGYANEPLRPVSDAELMLLEQRLNTTLPKDLRALYKVTNGNADMGLLPVAEIGFVADKFGRDFSRIVGEEPLSIYPAPEGERVDEAITLQPQQLSDWLYLGGGEGSDKHLYLKISTGKDLQGPGLLDQWSGVSYVTSYRDIRQWLEHQWVLMKQIENTEMPQGSLTKSR